MRLVVPGATLTALGFQTILSSFFVSILRNETQMNLVEHFHRGYIQNRRARILAEHLSSLIPHSTTLLDVGCGDGRLSARILESRGDIVIKGVDVLARSQSYFPVDLFDGQTIPADDGSFDVVMFVDVLHHTEDPMILLREAARVARRHIIIKDHLLDRPLAETNVALYG